MALDDALKQALRPIEGHALGIFLWGSHATGAAHERSDVDVCLVAGPNADAGELQSRAWRDARGPGLDLDVRVFEDLPLYLQGAVLDADHLLVSRDRVALYEYLRSFRRRWDDQKHRQRVDADDVRRALVG